MRLYIIIGVIVILLLIAVSYMNRNAIVSKVTEKLSEHFSLGDYMVTSKPFPNIPNEKEKANIILLNSKVVQPIRYLLKVPVTINSAFRSEDVNKAVGGVDNSQHRLGFAADLHITGVTLENAFKQIAKSNIPYDQLIIETNADGGRWIHVSYNPAGGRRQLLSANWNFATKKMDYKTMTV